MKIKKNNKTKSMKSIRTRKIIRKVRRRRRTKLRKHFFKGHKIKWKRAERRTRNLDTNKITTKRRRFEYMTISKGHKMSRQWRMWVRKRITLTLGPWRFAKSLRWTRKGIRERNRIFLFKSKAPCGRGIYFWRFAKTFVLSFPLRWSIHFFYALFIFPLVYLEMLKIKWVTRRKKKIQKLKEETIWKETDQLLLLWLFKKPMSSQGKRILLTHQIEFKFQTRLQQEKLTNLLYLSLIFRENFYFKVWKKKFYLYIAFL